VRTDAGIAVVLKSAKVLALVIISYLGLCRGLGNPLYSII
jgi:hypothetical protein